MSYRSGHHSDTTQHHHPQDHGRTPARRRPATRHPRQLGAGAATATPSCMPASRSGSGRSCSGSWSAPSSLLGMWSAATATYFAFRDDVLTRLIARQAEMQYAYEDRIAELRAKVDRTTSRQLLDQEQFDQKLDQIMRRQTALESRATALGAIPDVTVTGSIRPPARGAVADPAPSGTPKPSPISDTVIFVAPPDREARLESRTPVIVKPAAEPVRQGPGRRQRSGPPADLARPGRAPPDGGAQLGRGKHRIARPPDARRHHRSRPRHGAAGGRNAALGPSAAPSCPSSFPPTPAPSSASSTGSMSTARRCSGSTRRWRWCPIASR